MDLSIKQSVVFPPSPSNPSRSPFLRKHTGLHRPPDADMLRCRTMHGGEMPLIAATFGKIAEIWREEGEG